MKTYEIEFRLNDGNLIKVYPTAAKDGAVPGDRTITVETGHWLQNVRPQQDVVDCRDAARLNKIAKQLARHTYTEKFWMTMLLNVAADILAR